MSLEREHKLFTMRLKDLNNMTPLRRLIIFSQPTDQSRYSRSDLIWLFKILNKFADYNLKHFIQCFANILSSAHNLRGSAFKLDIPKPRTC